MLNKTKKFKLINHFPYLVVLSFFLVFFIFLTNSVNVYAANPSHTYTLPFNIDDYSDNQTLFDGIGVKVLEDYTNYVSTNNYNYNFDPTTMLVVPMDFNSDKVRIYVCSDPVISDTSNISSIYSSRVRVTFSGDYNSFIFTYSMTSSGIGELWSISRQASGWYFDMFGGASVQNYQNTGLTYQFLYPVDISSDLYDVNNNLVVTKYRGNLDEEEVFEDLDQFIDITSTISNGIDNTLTDLQNQKGFFDNLISNLKNFFNTLKTWIYGGFSTLMSNIKNFFGPLIRNIYNKLNIFLESFEDFKDKWNHFFEVLEFCYRLGVVNGEFNLGEFLSALFVPSSSDIDNAFTGHSVNTLYHGTVSASKTYYNFFTTVFNGNYVYIYSLPNFTFGGKDFQGLEVNFSWFLQYKSYCDVIISAFLIIAYIRFLLTFVNNFFYGSGFIDHDLNTIGGEKGVDYTIPY